MGGKVFVSSGQREGREQEAVNQIKKLLRERFGLTSYVATQVQGLSDIMRLTDELKAADYYLFVDFKRDGEKDRNEVSIFAHQELALAHHLEFDEIIALQEEGVRMEGFLKYVQSNPEVFETIDELLERVERLVESRGWDPDYSRNLTVGAVKPNGPHVYVDHTTRGKGRWETVWQVPIFNGRPDTAAEDVVAILEWVEYPDGSVEQAPDTTPLKWAGQHRAYRTTILPESQRTLDLFAVPLDVKLENPRRPEDFAADQGIVLHSKQDSSVSPRLLSNPGQYTLHYKVHGRNLPLLKFRVEVECNWDNVASTPDKVVEAKLLDAGH